MSSSKRRGEFCINSWGGVKDVVVKEVDGTNNQVHAVALLSEGSCGI